jgi:NAD(P)-dependent dehydrogenase (short-subunit alcohol dehydrogenase family)
MVKKRWTLEDMPSQQGKVAIVTGANSGLGFESCKALALAGASVIMGCRSLEKGTKAKEKIIDTDPGVRLEIVHLDLMDLESVKTFSAHILNSHSRLDILINNAGIMLSPFKLTNEGYEGHFATNHLGHFALTGLLMDLIKKSAGARVVNVSSIAHLLGSLNFEKLLKENELTYSPFKAYCRSKLANLLFTYELQRFFEHHSIDAKSMAAHPGFAFTNIMQYMGSERFINNLVRYFAWMIPSPKMGALSQLRAAVDPATSGGTFYGPGGIFNMRGYPIVVNSNKLSHDRKLAKALWAFSEELTGISYMSF